MEQPECRGTVDLPAARTARVACADGSWAEMPLVRMESGVSEGDRVVRGEDGIRHVDREAPEEARRRVRNLPGRAVRMRRIRLRHSPVFVLVLALAAVAYNALCPGEPPAETSAGAGVADAVSVVAVGGTAVAGGSLTVSFSSPDVGQGMPF